MSCPRCGSRLGVEHDVDYGWCINHGPIFIGPEIAFIEPGRMARSETARKYRSKGKDLVDKHCECGAVIEKRSASCRDCARKALVEARAAVRS